jgi:hypothetical protein
MLGIDTASQIELPAESNGNRRSRWAMTAVLILLLLNVLVPLLWGDVYPFTSAPMFRDSPTKFCNYRVISPTGDELPLENWLLQRIYDGNPVGYGVGVRPPPVIEQKFGVVHDEAAVREHVGRQLERAKNTGLGYVIVEQNVIGPIDGRHVGAIETNRWKVERMKK